MIGSNPIRSYSQGWGPPLDGGTDSTGQQPAQKASYSELLTIAVVGEILAQPKDGFAGYESTWYWIVNQFFREL